MLTSIRMYNGNYKILSILQFSAGAENMLQKKFYRKIMDITYMRHILSFTIKAQEKH